MISGGDIKAVQGTTGHASADMLVNTYAHIQQSSRVELGKKFEIGFYAKPYTSSPQAVPAAGEPTISMTALLELLKDADPASTLYVGDSNVDVETAHNANLPCCGAVWGGR